MTPFVYRNARYEFRLARAEQQIAEMALELMHVCRALEQLMALANPETHMPALPETPRSFGKGH